MTEEDYEKYRCFEQIFEEAQKLEERKRKMELLEKIRTSSQNDEDLQRFQEMSNFYKNDTGLPVNIWIDAAQTYKGHAKRIKFQLNKGKNIGGQPICSMLLDGTIPKKHQDNLKKNGELSEREINEVRNFVLNNAYALNMAADEKIHDRDFEKVMIKGGDVASQEEKNKQKENVDKIAMEYQKDEV